MLFDRMRELPMATVRRAPHGQLAVLGGDLRRWLDVRWKWLRPRTVPVLVAVASLFAVMESVSYLARPPAIEAAAPAVSRQCELASAQHCYGMVVEFVEP
jgi:hypothetical protein